ncbi:uncharacterized protein LOC127923014 [Oncorhynchus keta]|uniref:uncharacterized protein LOC127923014 n=1 Tax=Oncorhynchus keta TaxID=8018 RepID=UPI00227C1D46|nr:uncharacterized protein LOC127923014 [Oncorhynchus keta]
MHLLLEEAFSLASGGHSSTAGRHHHSHHPHHGYHHGHYSPGPPPLPYSDVVTSAPGTMSRGRGGGLQWVPAYGADMYQCSLPKPAFRFNQLPDMVMTSPPPPIPPRTGPPPGTSLRRSPDLGLTRISESGTYMTDMQTQHNDSSAPVSSSTPSVPSPEQHSPVPVSREHSPQSPSPEQHSPQSPSPEQHSPSPPLLQPPLSPPLLSDLSPLQ